MPGEARDAAIRLERVTKSFDSKKVLNDISFEVPKAEGFCLLGRSGTGKSVTLRHIIGLVRPDRGKVFVEGREITGLAPSELSQVRKRMGFLFQNAALFDSMTVGDNVAFPLRRHTKLGEREIHERALDKLEEVGLGEDYDKMPADLSGGMKKRAALARAMALDPPILLVDEPSAGLDPITAAEIDELLVERKRGGTTLVVVTHNIPSARVVADRLAMLNDGRIIAEGTVEELDHSGDPLVQAFMQSKGGG
jgi:phospholipid/cholesterol/gamma-HCH transport system ATP-binding protein